MLSCVRSFPSTSYIETRLPAIWTSHPSSPTTHLYVSTSESGGSTIGPDESDGETPSGSKPSSISIGPSQSGSAKRRVTFRKSITTKWFLPSFSLKRVPRPIICLNSVMEPIISSRTINFVILQSAPVESSFDVVAITG